MSVIYSVENIEIIFLDYIPIIFFATGLLIASIFFYFSDSIFKRVVIALVCLIFFSRLAANIDDIYSLEENKNMLKNGNVMQLHGTLKKLKLYNIEEISAELETNRPVYMETVIVDEKQLTRPVTLSPFGPYGCMQRKLITVLKNHIGKDITIIYREYQSRVIRIPSICVLKISI
ncbi:hypothetical protein ACWJJH_03060 [Endozoicomonadaceae bacterium StTr2]